MLIGEAIGHNDAVAHVVWGAEGMKLVVRVRFRQPISVLGDGALPAVFHLCGLLRKSWASSMMPSR